MKSNFIVQSSKVYLYSLSLPSHNRIRVRVRGSFRVSFRDSMNEGEVYLELELWVGYG